MRQPSRVLDFNMPKIRYLLAVLILNAKTIDAATMDPIRMYKFGFARATC